MNILRSAALLLLAALPALAAAPAPAAPSDLDLARRLENAFVNVAADASDSVVVITSTQQAEAAPEGDEDDQPEPPRSFEDFFRDHGLPAPPQDRENLGSGVILRADGYILTNNHVVDGGDDLQVRLKDGTKHKATLIGVDPLTDLAVIKIDAQNLAAARLGNSDEVRVGQWAIAIGAPYQLEYSFTVGFISAKGRSAVWSRSGSAYENYLQTDASINPGNSGGPLCDIEGRVIGINTMIRGINRGIGFAIPINMAREVADHLIAKGKVVRPWVGIQIQALAENKPLAELTPAVKDGVVVLVIYPGTPAAASSLKPADIIVAVDDVPVANPRDLQNAILHTAIGQKVILRVIRDGQPLSVSLQTGELPAHPQPTAPQPPRPNTADPAPLSLWGISVQALTSEMANRFGLDEKAGVLVTGIQADTPAAAIGLRHGDVIAEIDRQPIRTPAAFAQALEKSAPDRGALLYVLRQGTATFLVLKKGK